MRKIQCKFWPLNNYDFFSIFFRYFSSNDCPLRIMTIYSTPIMLVVCSAIPPFLHLFKDNVENSHLNEPKWQPRYVHLLHSVLHLADKWRIFEWIRKKIPRKFEKNGRFGAAVFNRPVECSRNYCSRVYRNPGRTESVKFRSSLLNTSGYCLRPLSGLWFYTEGTEWTH